jgi:alpha-galactosidase
VLGCNHPIWPSLGLIHGSRSSNDIKRSWDRFETTARQNLSRNWQNGRLWWNDPDAVVLTGELSEDEFRFHATSIFATGGMLLSGDDLTKINADRLAMLRKLQPPTGEAARFDDDSFRVGRMKHGKREIIALLNFDDRPQTISFNLTQRCVITDFWSGESLGQHERLFTIRDMPRHSGRLLICT